MNEFNAMALFRVSVLGPLVSRDYLHRGELQHLIRELAQREYAIPGSRRRFLGEKTIEAWYYAWRKHGIVGLMPKPRKDRGISKLPADIQDAIVAAKRENPKRSIRTLQQLLEQAGIAARGTVSRSAIHRLLQQQGLSRITVFASESKEYRRFDAEYANSIWYGDVMHGPTVTLRGKRCKVYLVTLLDDASRLIAHSAFCLGETAVEIEGVLKQAVLKRGLPRKLVVDNGPAYRATTLQEICVRLGIRLIYCRPYAPEGKGKLERWHRTFRDQFLSELDTSRLADLDDLNVRLWAWIEQIYHRRPHFGLDGKTPIERYQQDLPWVKGLDLQADCLDAIFYHRVSRNVSRAGTVSYKGKYFEVPWELSDKTVQLVVDPHTETIIGVEDGEGNPLGTATPLDAIANAHRRRRCRLDPDQAKTLHQPESPNVLNVVELAYQQYASGAGQEVTSQRSPTCEN